MARKTRRPQLAIEIEAPSNGRVGKATVSVIGPGNKTLDTDKADLNCAAERQKVARRLAGRVGIGADALLKTLEDKWHELRDSHRRVREQAEAGSPEAAPLGTTRLLDASPATISRPLCLVSGRAYAAAWVPLKTTLTQSVVNRAVVKHDPPLVTVEDVLLVVGDDGTLFADGGVPDARPLAELAMPVHLPTAPAPGRGWSGAGVKRFFAGERPGPAEVFARVASVVDAFIDFARSLGPQEAMCELTGCYVLGTYLLDAFNVVGYLWPNGERGTGKTSFLQVVAELSYLGQLILAGSSYACLRDLADYGATLCFDDAEGVMDVRRTDPEKRTLLLAGNRRGATVAVKEASGEKTWVTRHVNTFCPRLFSAIRLPDEVLGSRSIIVPLVRSGDGRRAKANPLDAKDWPTDRRRLVDDLWALGLAHLHELSEHDREAAAGASLSGRALDPWRTILGVAHWLEQCHGVAGLYGRMERLAVDYQRVERGEYEDNDRTRVLLRVLAGLCGGKGPEDKVTIRPGEVAQAMIDMAKAEDLADSDKPFTSARKVGYLLKRQRFRRPAERDSKGKAWEATCAEIRAACHAYGVAPPEDATTDSDAF
jgi:hypothetical protein